jgi:hypothetical protein
MTIAVGPGPKYKSAPSPTRHSTLLEAQKEGREVEGRRRAHSAFHGTWDGPYHSLFPASRQKFVPVSLTGMLLRGCKESAEMLLGTSFLLNASLPSYNVPF